MSVRNEFIYLEGTSRALPAAKHADSFTQRRLLDLASEYEAK
jgi:hypothetical protein